MSTQKFKWIQFHALKIGEDFFSGKFRYTKSSYFLGRTVLDGNAIFVLPWIKIRSTRPFGKLANCAATSVVNVPCDSARVFSVKHLALVTPLRVIPAATEPVAGDCHDKPIV